MHKVENKHSVLLEHVLRPSQLFGGAIFEYKRVEDQRALTSCKEPILAEDCHRVYEQQAGIDDRAQRKHSGV